MKKNDFLSEEIAGEKMSKNGFDLIRIQTNENEEQVVSGRDLHEFLEVGTQYSKWIERKIDKYGFIENIDFAAVSQKRLTAQGNETTYFDHIMKISMAKEISMTENSKKGRQARLYFIKCEEAWNNEDMILARAFKIQNRKMLEYAKRIESMEIELKQKDQIISEYEPKASYYDLVLQSKGLISISLIAKDYGMSAIAFNKKLHELEIQYRQGGTWLLYQKYSGFGYTKSTTFADEKTGFSKMSTKWTQKGRLFLYETLKATEFFLSLSSKSFCRQK